MTIRHKKLLSISALSLPLSASAALVPVLSSIGNAFPDWENYMQYLITIPPLFMMFSLLFTSRLLSKFSPRSLAGFGILLITLAGFTPYFVDSFLYLLATRAVMGIGLGILTTIVGSLPATYFPTGKERDFATGIQAAFISAGGIAFSLLSGWLATRSWQAVFFVQLINLIPLFVCLVIMPYDSESNQETGKGKGQIFVKEAVPTALLSFICIAITCTFPLNLSLFVEKNALGNSSFVGMLASINSGIGFFIGLLFAKLMRFSGKLTLPFGLGVSAVAFFIVALSPNQLILLTGSVLFGIGTSVISPALYARLYEKVPTHLTVPAVGMLGVGSNLSQFLSPFMINPLANFFAEGEKTRYIVAGFAILLITMILLASSSKKRRFYE